MPELSRRQIVITASLNEVHHVELRMDPRYEGRYHLSCSTCGPLAWSARPRDVWALANEHRGLNEKRAA
jgi:hypothetical protein